MNYYFEDHLGIPLKQVLQSIQDRIMNDTSYFGIKTLKNPIDFWVYQEIIFQTKPDFIIEIGNLYGGSALAFAHFCDHLNKGKIIAIDVSQQHFPEQVRSHPRIICIEGDACASFTQASNIVGNEAHVLVIEDSAHTFDNTLSVLRTYSVLVKPGDYFIVEDGICHHGLDIGPNPGPYEAIEAFLKENNDFEADRSKESFFITWNPKGYLRRCR